MTQILLSAAGYVVIVFPLALAWHLGLFKEKYESFGYFAGEPNVALGLATVIIQGVALALIYPLFHSGSADFVRALSVRRPDGLVFLDIACAGFRRETERAKRSRFRHYGNRISRRAIRLVRAAAWLYLSGRVKKPRASDQVSLENSTQNDAQRFSAQACSPRIAQCSSKSRRSPSVDSRSTWLISPLPSLWGNRWIPPHGRIVRPIRPRRHNVHLLLLHKAFPDFGRSLRP